MSVQRGTRLVAFDSEAWSGQERGYRDRSDNECFWRPATVECFYQEHGTFGTLMVDVRFDHRPESISRGHFLIGTRPLSPAPAAEAGGGQDVPPETT